MRRRQAGQTRQAILDAAEFQFATNGYRGASLREIFRAARVGIGLMSYYFPSKDDLFEEVVNRKIEDIRVLFEQKFDRLNSLPVITARDIFRSYFEFFLTDLNHSGESISAYWNLISRISFSYDNEIVSKCLAKFDFIAERVVGALQRATPTAPVRKIQSALVLAEATVTTLKAADGLFSHRLGADGDIRDCIDQYAAMCAYGIEP